jgi:hypothetical protein
MVAVCQVLLRNLLFGLDGLTPRQEAYVRNRASVDFVVYNRVSADFHVADSPQRWRQRCIRRRSPSAG